MKIISLTKVLLIILTFYACGSTGSGTTYQDPHAEAHREMHEEFVQEEMQQQITGLVKSLSGTYRGKLPCSDCKGIHVELELFDDLTYYCRNLKMGEPIHSGSYSGKYRVLKGRIIELDTKIGDINFLRQKGDDLEVLDQNKNPYPPEQAQRYLLKPYDENGTGEPHDAGQAQYLDKWKRNVSFHAHGDHPDWSMEINRDRSVSIQGPGGSRIVLPELKELTSIDPRTKILRTSSSEGEMNISLEKRRCEDPESKKSYPYAVTANLHRPAKNVQQSFAGCGEYIPDPRLHGLWVIVKVDTLDIRTEDFRNKRPEMEMQVFDGVVFGNDGCNTFRGSLEFEDGEVLFGNMASTLMACPDMDKSDRISRAISGTRLQYKFDRDLYLYDNGKAVLVLRHLEN